MSKSLQEILNQMLCDLTKIIVNLFNEIMTKDFYTNILSIIRRGRCSGGYNLKHASQTFGIASQKRS